MRFRQIQWLIVLPMGVSVVLAAVMGGVSFIRPFTPPETLLMQVLILIAGLGGSYLFGQRSTKLAAQEVVKPHARSAFRRVLSLYNSLHELAWVLDQRRGYGTENHSLDVARAVVRLQIQSVADAMEDWRDIVPEEIEDIERRMQDRESLEDI